MFAEILYRRGSTLVRKMSLEPGEATPWHVDPFHRVSVILKGQALSIEFRDGRPAVQVKVSPGQVDWDEPGTAVHRAVNCSDVTYEEVVIFLLNYPDDVPQPEK